MPRADVSSVRCSTVLLVVVRNRIDGSLQAGELAGRPPWMRASRPFYKGAYMERTACCHCGSLRATVGGEPTVVNVCHCKACQRRTGAVMHSGVYFNKSQVRIEGPEKIYTRDVEGVRRKISFHFCPTCGSSVYWHLDLRPDHYGIAVGAFADPDFPPPTLSVWEQTKHSWINLPEGIQRFPQARV